MEQEYQEERKGMGKCVATAIIYPLIAIIIAFVTYNNGGIIDMAFYASVACSILAAILILWSGFYLVILPLPYVSLYWWGSAKARGGFANFLFFLLIIGLLALSMFFVFGDIVAYLS